MNDKKLDAHRLYILQAIPARVISINDEGENETVILEGFQGVPDGIVLDKRSLGLYFTNMGKIGEGEHFPDKDGTIEFVKLNSDGYCKIVQAGLIYTPKQLTINEAGNKLYWCDREGMRVMRANLDGSEIEVLVYAGDGEIDREDESRHCVGITLDEENGHIYWTQKGKPDGGQGRIFRTNIEIPKGIDVRHRDDIDLLLDNLPEPIDLEIDKLNHYLYWTDRGLPPQGNTLNRAVIDDNGLTQHDIVFAGFEEAIGLAIDSRNQRAFVTDLGGHVWCIPLDNPDKAKVIYRSSMLTGIAYG